MKKNNIDFNKIISEGGATLNKHGEDFIANEGFMVSLFGAEFKTTDEEIAKNKIEEYIEKIKTEEGLFVGVWLDEGEVYVDLSIHILDYNEALEVARNNKQKALFDLKNKTSIYLNYKKYYTLYEVIKDKDEVIVDYKIIKQYDKIEEIIKELNIKKQTLYNCISKNLDEVNQLIFNRWALIVDKISEEELIA